VTGCSPQVRSRVFPTRLILHHWRHSVIFPWLGELAPDVQDLAAREHAGILGDEGDRGA
jgi:hypothetical protein